MDEKTKVNPVILLGAGASVPFTNPPISTKLLTELIWDEQKWIELLTRFNSSVASNEQLHIEETLKIIIYLKDKLSDLDFEQSIEIIDKLASYYQQEHLPEQLLNRLFSVAGVGFSQFENHSCWKVLPFLFRQLISEGVTFIESSNRVVDFDKLTGLQLNLINYLAPKWDKVSIYSLNYDSIIIRSLHHESNNGVADVHNCFSHKFNPKEFLSSPRTIAFLHGHTSFLCNNRGEVTRELFNPPNEKRMEYLKTDESINYLGNTLYAFSEEYAYNYNTFIVTGKSKESAFYHNPYATYYQKLAQDILVSKEIYLIGYSMSDLHINRLLKNYTALDPNNKIIVVSYTEEDIIVDHRDFRKTNKLIEKILREYNPNGLDWKMKDEELRIKLNEIGYGYGYPQIYIYKKGYRAFLEEFREVIADMRLADYWTREEDAKEIGSLSGYKRKRI